MCKLHLTNCFEEKWKKRRDLWNSKKKEKEKRRTEWKRRGMKKRKKERRGGGGGRKGEGGGRKLAHRHDHTPSYLIPYLVPVTGLFFFEV